MLLCEEIVPHRWLCPFLFVTVSQLQYFQVCFPMGARACDCHLVSRATSALISSGQQVPEKPLLGVCGSSRGLDMHS